MSTCSNELHNRRVERSTKGGGGGFFKAEADDIDDIMGAFAMSD